MRKLIIPTILYLTMAFAAAAQTAPSISVENAWARPTPPAARAAAIYVTITDKGAPDRLIGMATPVAGKAELHETIHDGNVMKMRPVAGLAISSDAPVTLAPGGYHIMLTDLKQPLANGQEFPLSLRFEKAGSIKTTVMVKSPGGAAAMDMGGAAARGMGDAAAMDMGGSHGMQHMNPPGMTKP